MVQAYRALFHKHGAERAGYPCSNHMSKADAERFVKEWRESGPQFAEDVFSIVPVDGPILFSYAEVGQ